jgi:hypothetical protein
MIPARAIATERRVVATGLWMKGVERFIGYLLFGMKDKIERKRLHGN